MFSPDDLTSEQRCIVHYPLDRALYIEAPAGHGKTTTATLKAGEIARMLVESSQQQVLVLTFSKMAGRQIDCEMQQHVPKPLHSRILIRTYHSFYYDLIRHYARYLGFAHNNFGLLTAEERKALYLLFNVHHLGLDYMSFSYAQYLAGGICPPMPIEGHQPPDLVATAASFLEGYHKQQHRFGFEDFPYYAYRVLADSSFVCDLLAYKYPVVFLDEFQNTNDLQWAILQSFAPNVKLVVFADPSQTIHGFRGAGQVIESFKQEREPKSIPLTTNFRNSSSLYAFAKGIAAGQFDGPPPRSVTFHRLELYKKDKWQLKFDVLGLLRSSSPRIRSIGILAKENKHVSEVSGFLGRKTEKTPSIPHEVISDDSGTQDRENTVLALFQLAATCDVRYLTSVAGTLGACARGEANYLFYLNQAVEKGQCAPDAITSKKGVPGLRNARIVLSVIRPMVEATPPDEPGEAWQRAGQTLQGLRQISSIPDLSEAYARLQGEWDVLNTHQGIPTLESYMRHVMAQRRRRNFLEQRSYLRGVFLMTVHQSQGKQFDAVIIWRCNDGIIPHPEEIRKGDTSASQHLLYVGITRARYSVSIYYEQNKNAQPSRLIQPFLGTR